LATASLIVIVLVAMLGGYVLVYHRPHTPQTGTQAPSGRQLDDSTTSLPPNPTPPDNPPSGSGPQDSTPDEKTKPPTPFDPDHPAIKLTDDSTDSTPTPPDDRKLADYYIFNAVGKQDTELVQRIVAQHPTVVKLRNLKGATPLHLAAAMGNEGMVTAMLKAQTDVNVKCDKSWLTGQTPLHLAAGQGHLKIMRMLMDKGASVYARDGMGNTALHEAAVHGATEAAALLLQHGAEIDATQNEGYTPLFWAILSGEMKAVRLLATKGANINIVTDDGLTPLAFAESLGNRGAAVVDYLRQRGAQE